MRQSVALTAPIDPAVAAGLLADLGFIARPDLPDVAGDAYLLVALRERPTLRHFDPERIDLWVSRDSRGARLQVTRETHPFDGEFSWGTISIVDRLGISNDYVSFGGRITVEDVGSVTVAALCSPAPILRRGGHSQGWDEAAVDVGGWFGRVLLAVDYVPGFEARMAEACPVTRYAAFLLESVARYHGSEGLRTAHPQLWTLLAADALRLRRDHPAEWAAGLSLAQDAGTATPTAA